MIDNSIIEIIRVKNVHHERCLKFVIGIISQYKINIIEANIDFIKIEYNKALVDYIQLETKLEESGFGLIKSRDEILVDRVKTLVMDLIYEMNFKDSIVQKSDYISSKLNLSYEYLSKIFKKYENITLEKFIIKHRLQRVKELISQDKMSLSEISYMLDYSSVQYLSTQFKKEFGITPSEFKKKINNNKK